eukprot:CAMPEP_0114541568 /NCGR_PEP_ID=MMETSP0114-20121206/1374_1 /TAXON_ID=31324 /ORGANISM="Goniomonas sp, Strain m" /LENGTH=143 /DNA_ID=CAMNT_0001725813 /DNA_START=31 /DNA_END=462 /DNA_ORIENTATION=+
MAKAPSDVCEGFISKQKLRGFGVCGWHDRYLRIVGDRVTYWAERPLPGMKPRGELVWAHVTWVDAKIAEDGWHYIEFSFGTEAGWKLRTKDRAQWEAFARALARAKEEQESPVRLVGEMEQFQVPASAVNAEKRAAARKVRRL